MEQAAFSGLRSRWPCSSRVESACMSTPGYGILHPLNTSHRVTPNDHYSNIEHKNIQVMKERGLSKIKRNET